MKNKGKIERIIFVYENTSEYLEGEQAEKWLFETENNFAFKTEFVWFKINPETKVVLSSFEE